MNTPILNLGPEFYDIVTPAHFPQTRLRYRNDKAADLLHLSHLDHAQWIQHFAYFEPLPGNLPSPLALRYHGHQFMHYNPDLGDGRGFLYAQIKVQEKLYDLGTKGSGQTPYSRQGDGRLTLKGAFREILATELLESYGVNTSQTFSVIETGENLIRHDEPSPTRSAVLVRLCHSHIRFGTFQRLAFLQQKENLQKLLHYCVENYYPHLKLQNPAELATAFLKEVLKSSADVVASWMMCGFVHGVMNTDNMNITGECFDYGPYRFLPHYDPQFTAAYFDHQGLYCFGRQPITMLWNLQQLGDSLRVAYPDLPLSEVLDTFADEFNQRAQNHFLRRLNLSGHEQAANLISAFFRFLETEKEALYEQTFFDLHSGCDEERLRRSPQAALYRKDSFAPLKQLLMEFQIADFNKARHPYFQQDKACALLIEELESIWQPIAEKDDWSSFDNKLQSIRRMRGAY